MYPTVTSTTPKYRCGYPGCLKRYASTDGVRKHARKTHTQWLREVDEQSALRDHKLYGNKPSTYCIRETDDDHLRVDVRGIAHDAARLAGNPAAALGLGAAAVMQEELARHYRAYLLRSLHQQQASGLGAPFLPMARYAEAMPMPPMSATSLMLALGMGNACAGHEHTRPHIEEPPSKKPRNITLALPKVVTSKVLAPAPTADFCHECTSGAAAGTMPGTLPGTMGGTAPGTASGAKPGAMAGAMPGTMSGSIATVMASALSGPVATAEPMHRTLSSTSSSSIATDLAPPTPSTVRTFAYSRAPDDVSARWALDGQAHDGVPMVKAPAKLPPSLGARGAQRACGTLQSHSVDTGGAGVGASAGVGAPSSARGVFNAARFGKGTPQLGAGEYAQSFAHDFAFDDDDDDDDDEDAQQLAAQAGQECLDGLDRISHEGAYRAHFANGHLNADGAAAAELGGVLQLSDDGGDDIVIRAEDFEDVIAQDGHFSELMQHGNLFEGDCHEVNYEDYLSEILVS